MSRWRRRLVVNIKVRFPTEEDAITLAENLRESDANELKAVTDLTHLSAIRTSISNSDPELLWSFYADDDLLCIAGCTRTGNPWLLATPTLNKHLKSLTQSAKTGVRMMLKTYPMLTNMIDVRQTMTIRWLEAIGFTMMDTLELKQGFPLLRFQKVRHERTCKNSTRDT